MDGDGDVKLKMEMFFRLLLLMWQQLKMALSWQFGF